MFVPLDEAQEFFWVTYLLRVERPGPELMAAVEREIQAVRADAVLTDGGVMGQRLMRSIRDRSFATVIVGFFAMVALGVSAAGIIGVVGSVVARRTREIAIRMTLGAGRAAVRRLVAQEALTASGIGAVVGLAIGAAVSSTLESLLYGVTAADPVALLLAALSIVVIVVVAAWAPARRAVRLSPTDALRIE
jgi:ABC-type antimicrobial peptide transport system permease subunit